MSHAADDRSGEASIPEDARRRPPAASLMASDLATIVFLLLTVMMLFFASVTIYVAQPLDTGTRLALTAIIGGIPATLLAFRVWSLIMLARRGVEVVAYAAGGPYPSPGDKIGWIQEYGYEWLGKQLRVEVKAYFAVSARRFGRRALILVDPRRPQRAVVIADATKPAGKPIRWRGLQPRAVLFGVLSFVALSALYFGTVGGVLGDAALVPRPIHVAIGVALCFLAGYVAAAIAGDRPLAHASALAVAGVLLGLTAGGLEPMDAMYFLMTVAGGFVASLADRSALDRERRRGAVTPTS
jgi:hypothetical protein